MDKQTIRPLVFEILKRTPQTHFHAIENDLRRICESYERRDILTLQEILWELLVQGVLAPGKNSLNLNLPFVHVTDYGTQCLEDGVILTHDPDRYIAQLRERVGCRLDEFIVHSVHEALLVFLAGSWTSSVILLARAAEVMFDKLSEALQVAQVQDTEPQLSNSPRFTRTQAQAVIQMLLHRNLPSEINASLEPQLNGLMGLIQFSRETNGSPRWPQPSRNEVQGFFLLFPEQCAFVYDLLNTLDGNVEAQKASI